MKMNCRGGLRIRFVILQGTGTKRTGRALSDSNAAESQICGGNRVSSCPMRVRI